MTGAAARDGVLRALVIGSTGFVGRHLTRRLSREGWDVHVVLRRQSSRRPALPDATHIHVVDDSVAEVGAVIGVVEPFVVFHVAAFTGSDQSRFVEMIESNVTLTTAVARAATSSRARLVHVSTAWQHYGGAEYSPVSLYAATKQAQCDIVRYFAEAEGLDAREVCLFDTYGPDDDRAKLLTLLVQAARTGEPLALSSGRQLVDLTHVDDVAAALITAGLHEGPVSRLVVRSGKPIAVRDLASMVSAVSGRRIDARWGGRPDRPREMVDDWPVRSDDLGWAPIVPLLEGLSQLWHDEAGQGVARR